jgi:hypothetical protein
MANVIAIAIFTMAVWPAALEENGREVIPTYFVLNRAVS